MVAGQSFEGRHPVANAIPLTDQAGHRHGNGRHVRRQVYDSATDDQAESLARAF